MNSHEQKSKKLVIIRVIIALIFSLIIFIGYAVLLHESSWKGEFNVYSAVENLFKTNYLYIGVAMSIAIFILFMLAGWNAKLDNIKGKRVGDGQHGNARFLTNEEIQDEYLVGKLTDEKPGWIISLFGKRFQFVIDEGDINIVVLAPPGSGKTRRIVIPNIFHAMINKEVIFTTDTKSKLIRMVKPFAKTLGYKVIHIDAANPLYSNRYNFLDIISNAIDRYNLTDDKKEQIIYKSKAQRYAKILSNQIINIIKKNTSAGQNEFFYIASEGIISAIILLIAEYADEAERHIVSVLKVLLELMDEDSGNESTDLQKTKLYKIINMLPDTDKAAWLAAAGAKADAKVALSVFATGLSAFISFIDDEMEQMICGRSDFNIEELLENNKICVIVNIPEENKTRHFMYSLLINTFVNQLLDMSRTQPNGVLPFVVRILLDEFGTAPLIDGIDSTLTAARERKIYLMLIIQSIPQLYNKYGDKIAEVIIGACKTFIFSGLGALQDKDAERLSKAMGKFTAQSGSISKSNNKIGDRGTVSVQMIAKQLMEIRDIQMMKQGEYIVMRTGNHHLKAYLDDYTKYNLAKEEISDDFEVNNDVLDINYFSANELERRIHIVYGNKEESYITELEDYSFENDTNYIEPASNYVDEFAIIYNILEKNNDFEGITQLMNQNYKQVITQLYQLHKQDILAAKTFENFKEFLKIQLQN
jgi:Type IV secretory pathway, VirD4 components